MNIIEFYLRQIQPNRISEINLRKIKNRLKDIRHLELIDKLNLPKDKVLIMGSAVLVLHGIVDKNADLDLVVTRDVLNKMSKLKNIVKKFKCNKVFCKTKDDSMEAAVNLQILGVTTETLLRRALDIDGYKFMSLKDTYKMYRILNRKKDIEKLKKLKRIFSRGK